MVAQNTRPAQTQQTTQQTFLNTRTWQTATFNARAIQLAEEHGLMGTGRGVAIEFDDHGDPAYITVRVRSQSQADGFYDVIYTVATDSALCVCRSAQYGRPCAHSGEGMRYGRYVRALYRPAAKAEAERMAERDLAHEGNAAALGY